MPGSFSQPRGKSVDQSHFAMVPRNDVPRSVFRSKSSHKTTFESSFLIPVYLDEVLPGDSWKMHMTGFARLQPLIYPMMDNIYLDSFWFFVPCRLLWDNWNKFMGESRTAGYVESGDYLIPVMAPNVKAGTIPGEFADYLGLPSSVQMGGNFLNGINALPFRAWALIYDDWFRDQNIQTSRVAAAPDFFGDGPDDWDNINYGLNYTYRRGKRHDYFTTCLPWPQKGPSTQIPLSGLAPIQGLGVPQSGLTVTNNLPASETARGLFTYPFGVRTNVAGDEFFMQVTANSATADPLIYADLSQATNALINDLRQAEAIQTLLERDARGGTRYVEILRSHFGVVPQDARLQRPEYLGGSSSMVNINAVAQMSETNPTGTPLGQLAGVGTGVHESGFSQSFTEHGYVIGMVNVRADLTYQQGLHKLWSRQTKHDFYWPATAHLGEQAVLRKEIYCTGTANDDVVFGYQERWGEYRYFPSKITGYFRSGVAGTLDAWHLAQEFSSAPTLSDQFIREQPPLERALAAGEDADYQQLLGDFFFDCTRVRPMPTYSVPGLGSRF